MVLMNGWEAEGEVCQARAQALFRGKHSQRQTDEKAEGPDQDKHENDQVHGGRLVRVCNDHGPSHGHSTQRVGAGCQAEGQEELVDLAGGVTQRPGVADSRVQGEGDEQESEEVSQRHAEQEDVQAVLTQGVVLGKQREDQQVGTEADAQDHPAGTRKDQPIGVRSSHVITGVTLPLKLDR